MRANSSKVILARDSYAIAGLPEPRNRTGSPSPEPVGRRRLRCALGGSTYRSGRSPDWFKRENPAGAVRREAEEDWGR